METNFQTSKVADLVESGQGLQAPTLPSSVNGPGPFATLPPAPGQGRVLPIFGVDSKPAQQGGISFFITPSVNPTFPPFAGEPTPSVTADPESSPNEFLRQLIMLLLLICSLLSSLSAFSNHIWRSDPEFYSRLKPGCDFPVVDTNNLSLFAASPPSHPVILRNLTNSWAAVELWQKQSLLDAYGDRLVRGGSESSIVYSAGHAEINIHLRDLLLGLGQPNSTAQFLFDTTILDSIPDLQEHFAVPGVFTSWDSAQEEAEHRMWHMLSIGPSRYGLPFHNHGQTWLAVVHGNKYWFVYPPGYGAPRSADNMFSPLTSAYDWYTDIYPHILQSAETKAPLHLLSHYMHQDQSPSSGTSTDDMSAGSSDGYVGYRPLECMQHPGDILYLPPMWSHMTMNIGETIGIGGQQYLSEQERFDIAWRNYRGDQSTYETLKDLALAIFAKSQAAGNALQDQLLPHLTNSEAQPISRLIHARGMQHLRHLLYDNMDSLVVLLHQESDVDSVSSFDELAQNMQDAELDFVHIIIESDRVDLRNFHLSSCSLVPLNYTLSSVCSHNIQIPLPAVVFYPGLSNSDFAALYKDDNIISTEVSLPSPVMLGSITIQPSYAWRSAIQSWLESSVPAKGSVRSVTVRNKVQALRSVQLIKMALRLRPVQPELHFFLSNIGSSIPVWDVLKESLVHAEQVYDDERSRGRYQKATLASLYYKLASIYQQYEDQQEAAARTLEKSLLCMDSFLPSLLDITRMFSSESFNSSMLSMMNIDNTHYLHHLRDLYDRGLVGKHDVQTAQQILKLNSHNEL
eukprot:gene24303-29383_t